MVWTMSPPPRSRAVRGWQFSVALLAPLLLAGCGLPLPDAPAAEDPAVEAPAVQVPDEADSEENETPAGAGEAALMMAGESFSFKLDVCMFDEENLLASGPGVGNESGDPAYLNIDVVRSDDFSTGGARIDLGTDEQFSSAEDFYSLNLDLGDEYHITLHSRTFVFEGDIRFRGENELGWGTFTVEC
jgi:hypothetical protein